MTSPIGTIAKAFHFLATESADMLTPAKALSKLDAMIADRSDRLTMTIDEPAGTTTVTLSAMPMQRVSEKDGAAVLVAVKCDIVVQSMHDGRGGRITINNGKPIPAHVVLMWPDIDDPSSLRSSGFTVRRGDTEFSNHTRSHYAITQVVLNRARRVVAPHLTPDLWRTAFEYRALTMLRDRNAKAVDAITGVTEACDLILAAEQIGVSRG